VEYGKVTAERNALFTNTALWENIEKWQTMPLEELRRDPVLSGGRYQWIYDPHYQPGSVLDVLDKAARCKSCDWQLPIGEQDFFSILIPEVQQARRFARLLAVRARIQIAQGQFDESLHTLQTGYAQARHVAEGPTFIHGLVGIAICKIMNSQLRTLIEQPGAPNLYWALTQLPRPMIDMRRAMDVERHAVALSFPEFRDLDKTNRTPEQWRQMLLDFGKELGTILGGWDSLQSPEVLTVLSIKGYPTAKRALIQQGLPLQEVEAMPVPQVILLYTLQTYEDHRDQSVKWLYVPYREAIDGLDEAEKALEQNRQEQREIFPLVQMFTPATKALRTAMVRSEREIAVLRVIEALRLYGASHNGRLPERLSDVTEVPVPDDPVTGRPFAYRLDGDTAVLEGPPLMPRDPSRFEISFAK
jgi:hypothetical protein